MSTGESVSVIIPSLQGDPLTAESIPKGVETIVVTGERRPVARNLGAERASGDILVFCDDDIEFSEDFFWNQIRATDSDVITGLEDYDFGFLITRFMIVHNDDFIQLGGFDERLNYLEDTEFCLNARSHGLELRPLPRDSVQHEEHDSIGKNRWVITRNVLYLSLRYPRYAPRLVGGVL